MFTEDTYFGFIFKTVSPFLMETLDNPIYLEQ